MADVFPRAMDLALRGGVALPSVIIDRFPLAEAAEAFRVAAPRRGLEVVVEPV